MLTFSKTVRTTQLDILNKPHSLADKISPPRHNSLDTTRQTQRPLPTRQTQQTSLTGRRNVPDLDTTRQNQRALLKNQSTILTNTVRQYETPPREPTRQTRRPAKPISTTRQSQQTDFTEHCKLGKRPTQQTPPTLLAINIALDNLNSFTIIFSSISQLISIFFRKIKLSTLLTPLALLKR